MQSQTTSSHVYLASGNIPDAELDAYLDGIQRRFQAAGRDVQVYVAEDALALLDRSSPFATVFKQRSLTTELIRGVGQFVLIPDEGDRDERAGFDVTLISSVFKGMRFLPAFIASTATYTRKNVIENMIILAGSPEDELSYFVETRASHGGANFVIVFLPQDPGLYDVWNLGVVWANGRYLGNSNLDDFRAPTQVERLMDMLDAHPEASVASTACALIRECTGDWSKLPALKTWVADVGVSYTVEDLFTFHPNGDVSSDNIPHCSPLWRKALHEKYGYFDEKNFGPSADWEFWVRCGSGGETFLYIPDVLVLFYVSPSTYWARNPDNLKFYTNIVGKYARNGKVLPRYDGREEWVFAQIAQEHHRRNAPWADKAGNRAD